jgi:hypothetical protein
MCRKDVRNVDSFESGVLDRDSTHVRRGAVQEHVNPKCKRKGLVPVDSDRRLWAPLHYFVYSIAGITYIDISICEF